MKQRGLEDSEKSAYQWQQWSDHQQILNPEEIPPLEFPPKIHKPKSAFKLFKLDNIIRVKNEHPEFGFKERLELLKQMWKDLSRDEKFLYVQKSKQLKF